MVLLLVLLACLVGLGDSSQVDVAVIDLSDGQAGFSTFMAVQTCVGLFNRQPQLAGAAYVVRKAPQDWEWLQDVKDKWVGTVTNTTVEDFLVRCLSGAAGGQAGRQAGGQAVGQIAPAKGFLRYNYTSQHLIVPQLVTLAGVLDAVPLEDGHPAARNATKVFDAVETFGTNTSLLNATRWVFDHYVNSTTTLAMMDPGFSGANTDPFSPTLSRDPNPALIDSIVQRRLFNMYMVDACIPLTDDYALMEQIVTSNPWPRPIAVWGYDDTFPIAGDLFEAETDCNSAHNMGQVASDDAINLSFFSLQGAITTPLRQNPTHIPEFNGSKTYLAITVGDGDNLSYLQGSRRSWMQQRIAKCDADPANGCPPLLWSLSPHTLQQAPGWAHWFYNASYTTGHDYFVLPPSGHLYAYPSMMPDADQKAFAAQTEADAQLMSTNAAVAWEFTGSWENAIDNYFPRYSAAGVVQGFFAVNVPFMLPVLPFLDGEFYKVLGSNANVVLFRPREWRGTNASQAPPLSGPQYLTPEQMAKEINTYPNATVTHIYLTSDGGANLDTIYSLIPLLQEHVQLVDHEGLVHMALAAHARSDKSSNDT